MATPTAPDIAVEDLLKIIGDKAVQLMTKSAHIKSLSDRIMELEADNANRLSAPEKKD